MADEQRTVLRVEGDPSGGQAALNAIAAGTRKSAAEVAAASAQETQAVAGAAAAQTQAQDQVAAGGEKVAEATDNLGGKQQRASSSSRGFAQALGLISPEAAGAARGLHDIQEGMEFLGTKSGLAMLGAAAAVAAVVAAIEKLNAMMEEAKRKLQEFHEAQLRLQETTTQRQETMAEALAKQGQGSQEALDKGMSRARRLETMGYSRQAAQDAVAATIGADGASTVSPEEEELLAAAVQTGQVSLGGKTRRERAAALKQALRFVGRNKGDVTSAAVALKRPRQMQNQAAAEGDENALVAALKRETGMDDEQAKQYAQAMKQFGAGAPEYATEFFSTEAWSGKAAEKRAAWEKANEGWRRLGNNLDRRGSGGVTIVNHGVINQAAGGPQLVPRMVGENDL